MDRTGIDDLEVKCLLELKQYFADHWVIYDVGSNKGGWSDILIDERDSSYNAGKYTAHFFEPNDMMLNYTRVKYEYNEHIIYNALAVSAFDGEVDFYYFTNFNNGLSSIYNDQFWADQKLPVKKGRAMSTTLDKYRFQGEVDIIKIDVEGAEVDVLKGMKEILKAKKVKFIQVEYGAHYRKKDYLFKKDVIEYVTQFGYNVYLFNGEYFDKVLPNEFVEDYGAKNYIISHMHIERYHYTQLWNNEFKENTKQLHGKITFALEIGCFEGLTSNYICDHLLRAGGRMICVDPLTDEYIKGHYDNHMFVGQYDRFARNTKGQPIELYRMQSVEAWPMLKDFRFDFIYVDGDHREESVFRDAWEGFKLLKEGGYMLFDDYKDYEKGTTDGINRALGRLMGQYQTMEVGYQILIRKI